MRSGLCPELVLVSPHYDLYDTSSKAFMEILREFSPCVEQYSVDEAYCDMTGTIGLIRVCGSCRKFD